MNKSFSQPKLSQKILIYINYILPKQGYKFSYVNMQKTFAEFYQKEYSIRTLRKEFSNLKRAGFVAHTSRYRKPYPVLTRDGKLYITPHLPYKKFETWDKRWRIVLFNIPEIDREYRTILRQNLLDLGFQKIQKGVYISPHDFLPTIRRVATDLGIRQHLTIFEADKIDREKFAIQKIWPLEEINKDYKDFIQQTKNEPRNQFWPFRAKYLEQQFYEIYKKDPHLPKELLLPDWQGEKAYGVYKEITRSY